MAFAHMIGHFLRSLLMRARGRRYKTLFRLKLGTFLQPAQIEVMISYGLETSRLPAIIAEQIPEHVLLTRRPDIAQTVLYGLMTFAFSFYVWRAGHVLRVVMIALRLRPYHEMRQTRHNVKMQVTISYLRRFLQQDLSTDCIVAANTSIPS